MLAEALIRHLYNFILLLKGVGQTDKENRLSS